MLIAVSVTSADIEQLRNRWNLESIMQSWPLAARTRKAGYLLPQGGPEDLGPVFTDASTFGGYFMVLDLEQGREVWRTSWGNYLASPSGFCFDGTTLFCADLEGGHIFEIDMVEQPGRLVRRISHPAFNDLHHIVRTRRGLLVASTGCDMAIEVDLEGNSLFEWWAADHGFASAPDIEERHLDRGGEHRDQYYPTTTHVTHLNAVRYRDATETHILALLWRQGMLVEIDVATGQAREVLSGLQFPHVIRPLTGGGWVVCNTCGGELVVLDADLRVERRIPSVQGWIQDAMPLDDRRWLVLDNHGDQFVLQDDRGAIERGIPFNPGWRPYGIEAVPARVALAIGASTRGYVPTIG